MNDNVTRRLDGKYEERLDEIWFAEYAENHDSGLWGVEIFKRDIAEWRSSDYTSLEDARQAAHAFYDQL